MALGKGLGSLIPNTPQPSSHVPAKHTASELQHQVEASEHAGVAQADILYVPVTSVVPNPHQPRQHFNHEALEELINSIKEYGILQPLLVTKAEEGYELIAGERRLRASKIAGLEKVPVIVRDSSELEKVELALIENIQRSDLNSIEKAESYRKLLQEFGLNHEEAAKKLGISRPAFSNTIRLLDLPGSIQKAVADGVISEGHAKIIVGLPNAKKQTAALKRVVDQNLSVKALQEFVSGGATAGKTSSKKSNVSTKHEQPHVQALADELSQALATKVSIETQGEGGTIHIAYYSPEELPEIIRKISK